MSPDADRSIVPCNGKRCARFMESPRAEADTAQPCPFIQARYGTDDLCRCCDGCRSACRDDIKDPHA